MQSVFPSNFDPLAYFNSDYTIKSPDPAKKKKHIEPFIKDHLVNLDCPENPASPNPNMHTITHYFP